MFERQLLEDLVEWKTRQHRSPLIVRGARQVGKTSLIRDFAKRHFAHLLEINLESDKNYRRCFASLDPREIIQRIESLSNQRIEAGSTLLFIDEIQELPEAISALRYFKENLPMLHVIAAGSLLEFALESKALKMPVGRVEFLYLYPLSFEEYLSARGKGSWLEQIRKTSLHNAQDVDALNLLHTDLQKCLQEYFIVGGMPDAVRMYSESNSPINVERIQNHILMTYEGDFAKYASSKAEENHIQLLFEKLPGITAQPFRYNKVCSDIQSRSLKPALHKLVQAQVIHRIYASTASGLPLKALINEKKFKLLMSDIGLYTAAIGVSADVFLSDDLLLVNKGVLAEQFVGQELAAHSTPFKPCQLIYWSRDKGASKSEVDYVIQQGTQIVPIEVKAGNTGRLKSLHIFMSEKNASLGIKLSMDKLAYHANIMTVPLYMIGQLDRLIHEQS